jgi:hypothetical protein
VQVVEHLPSKLKALSSYPSTIKTNKTKIKSVMLNYLTMGICLIIIPQFANAIILLFNIYHVCISHTMELK